MLSGLVVLIVLAMQPLSVIEFAGDIDILFPKGIVAAEERDLLFILQAIMLVVVIPVYILTFVFCWKYRAQNQKATYDPDLVDSTVAEFLWWGIPLVIVIIVGGLSLVKTYELDPYKPLVSDKKTKTIQVVALQWKWLFIYPEEKIASLNFLQIPEKTPIHFEITSDAPMNSFWIPRLGGQIYAMPAMKTELHLIADETGEFNGSSANLSGEGFASMHFVTKASSEEEYQKWVSAAQSSAASLDRSTYDKIALPSTNDPVQTYQLSDARLFDQILNKYMHPQEK